MGKHRIPADRYIPGQNPSPRKYIKSRQCAAVYTRGNRAGTRCTWYAQEDRIYCIKHGRYEGNTLSDEHKQKRDTGRDNWWARIKELEKTHPGLMREVFNIEQTIETRRKRKEIEKTVMPKPETDDKTVLSAHKAIVAVAADLPKLPEKPFEEMEPHEQLVAITGQSLKVVHEILSFSMTDESGVPNPKMVSIVKDTALRALAVRVKTDRNALAAKRLDKMAELLERLKQPGDDAKVIDAKAT